MGKRRKNKKVVSMDFEEDEDIPKRPDGLKKLPKNCLKRLNRSGLSIIKPEHLKLFMTGSYLEHAKSTARRGPFHISDNGAIAFLCWKITREEFTELLKSASWKLMAGDIRDQNKHIICWAYGSSDLTSVIRVIRHWEDKYIPLCPWYLCRHVDPDMLGHDADAYPGHVCYGSSLKEALEHIEREGIPEELPRHRIFDCCDQPPSASNRKHKIKSILSFDTLDKALAHLHIQPIGAALIVFPELWTTGNDIYYGPLAENSHCLGYHNVVILEVGMYKGEQVALCKMSNGKKVAWGGYALVSLQVLYMAIGGDGENAKTIRPTPTPRHLLSDFHCPEMDEAPRGNPKLKRKQKQEQHHHEPKRAQKRRRQREALGSSTLHPKLKRKQRQEQRHEPKRSQKRRRCQREALSSSTLHSCLDDDEIASLHGQVGQLINTRDTESHNHEEDRPAVVNSDNLQLSFGSCPLSNNLGETSDVAPQMEHSDARSTDFYGQSMRSSNSPNIASSSGSRSISMPVGS